jgi:oligo-1,6-glucosidase/alpha-glucosidase
MTLPWYHKTTIYHVYPRSFYDSNGDGIGDIQGILLKLDYLQSLGIETIWVSPIFGSPQADFGYDVSSYTDIAPEFGTMEDVEQLIEDVHRRGMKIIFDLVLNHTSVEHPWFKESRSSRDNPKADWFLWRDRPNNWLTVTGGSGWQYAKERDQYFWTTFLPFQPDLNYRNPDVKRTMLEMVRFWLRKGVDGFRLDIFHHLYKDADFRDNPFSFKLLPTPDDPSGFLQEAKYTANQPESFEFAREFRRVCEEFGEKLSIGEVTGENTITRRYLGERENTGLTLVFDFRMLNFKFTADYFRGLILDMEEKYPEPFMPVYVFSNLDKHRSAYRLERDQRKSKLLHMLQLTVRGVPCLYYGEEIGMSNARLPFATALDPLADKYTFLPRALFDTLGILVNRDEVRTPMQWDSTDNAGFSAADETWLPVHKNYTAVNAEGQSRQSTSLLNSVRTLLEIRRREKALHEGSLALLEHLPGNVLGFERVWNDEKLVVLLNFDDREKTFPWQASEPVFRLTEESLVHSKLVRLGGYGGLVLRPACVKH